MMIDRYTLELFNNLTRSVAEEMGAALHRTAFSPNIKERKDHSCAVFDPAGRLVAQAEHIPVHLGSMPDTVKSVLDSFELEEGDIAVLNDPFEGGTHLPDISMVSPVFREGRMVAILASRAHHSDVGGLAAGSIALTSEIYQEGLVVPPVRLKRRGERDGDIERFICANTRNPTERRGDLEAQMGAHATGESRISAIFSRYGTRTVLESFDSLMDYSEALTRQAISQMPSGEFEFTDFLDDDGLGNRDIPVRAALSIGEESVVVDFSGTSPPVEGPLNCPRAVTLSAVYYVIRCVVGDDVPANEGAFRPVEVIIPDDCLLCARRPYAVCGGNVETSQRVVDSLLGALSKALPDRIPAASYGTMTNIAFGSIPGDRGEGFAYYETVAGGTGGHPRSRGASATHAHMTNTRNTPVEALEYSYPLRINSYRIRRRSGGSGFHRGGDGVEREIEALEECQATLLSDRRSRGPWGLQGGLAGRAGVDSLRESRVGNSRSRRLPSKCNMRLAAGDRLNIKTPGGGGWGSRNR